MSHARKVKVTFVEVHHGKLSKFTRVMPSIEKAEQQSKNWNAFNNPYEALLVLNFKEVKK